MIMLRISILLLFSVLLCSCAGTGGSQVNHYYPVKNLAMRKSTLGFSIQPPLGTDWYEKLNDNTLYYLKKLPSKTYSIYTKATEIKLADPSRLDRASFVRFVKEKKKLDGNGDYRNIRFNYALDPDLSPYCVRYTQDYDDHSQKRLGDKRYIIVKNRGIVCMHPRTPDKGIDMYYVEKYLPRDLPLEKSYQEEAEFFLSSLRFSRPKG